MPRRRKRSVPRSVPKRIAARPTPPLPVTILGVTYHPKPKGEERFTPESRQVRFH